VIEMLSIRLPQELEDKLEKIAKNEERPKSYIIRKALERYFEDLEDFIIASKRLNDPSAEYFTSEQATKYLGF
jgi:RHH-type transcriptional regulator, rel operon repressor / antitoxin RelB